jgi:hypothetical protein
MTDIIGPMNAANSTTSRPSDTRTPGGSDTFFRDCSSPTTQDGTAIQAAWLNQVTVFLRALARGNGLKLDNVTKVLAEDNTNDALLLQAVQYLIQRGSANYAVDTGTANAVAFTANPAPPEIINGMQFSILKGAAANTGAVTVNGSPLTWADGSALIAGDWPASTVADIIKTAAGYVILSIPGPSVFSRKTPTRIVPVTATTTLTFAPGETRARIRGNGPAAGGGGSYNTGGIGAGGGAGAYIDALVSNQAAGNTLAFTIGAHGVGGSGAPTNGTAAGATTITGTGVSITLSGATGGTAGNNALGTPGGTGSVITASGANLTILEAINGPGGGTGFVTTTGLASGVGGISPRSGGTSGPNVAGAGSAGPVPGAGGNGGVVGNVGGDGASASFVVEFSP